MDYSKYIQGQGSQGGASDYKKYMESYSGDYQQVHEGPELPGRVVPNSSSFQLDFCFEDSGCLGFRASGNLASFLVQSLCGRSWGLRNSGLIILTLGRPPRLARDQHCDRTHRLAAVM